MKKIYAFLISFFLFWAVIAASFFIYQKVYTYRIYPGVTFLGVNLSGKTFSEAKEEIEKSIKEIEKKEIKINSKPIALTDAGISIDNDKIAVQAYDYGHKDNFTDNIKDIIKSIYKSYEVSLIFEINQEKFKNLVSQLASEIEREPKNATLIYQDNGFIFKSSEKGKKIDEDQFKRDLADIVTNSNQNIEIAIKTKEVLATITDKEQALSAQKSAEEAINKTIILSLEDKKFTIDSSKIAGWIVFMEKNSKLVANLDNGKIKSYLSSEIAKDIDIKPVDQQVVVNADGTPKEVMNEKKDGRALNQDKALVQIKEAIRNSGAEIKIALETSVVAAQEKIVRSKAEAGSDTSSVVVGRESGKYIDINLSAQRLGIIEGEQIVSVYAVSTGKWSMPTPQGKFQINSKVPRAYSKRYNLYMPYWMAFVGSDYGIHELPEWANGYKEGANHLGTPVSHGCVRLDVGAAETVYNWTEIGTSVYVHK